MSGQINKHPQCIVSPESRLSGHHPIAEAVTCSATSIFLDARDLLAFAPALCTVRHRGTALMRRNMQRRGAWLCAYRSRGDRLGKASPARIFRDGLMYPDLCRQIEGVTCTTLFNTCSERQAEKREGGALAFSRDDQFSSCLSRLRTSPSMSASRARNSSIRRTAWITVEWSRPPNFRPISG
jgi:hypothetical protein